MTLIVACVAVLCLVVELGRLLRSEIVAHARTLAAKDAEIRYLRARAFALRDEIDEGQRKVELHAWHHRVLPLMPAEDRPRAVLGPGTVVRVLGPGTVVRGPWQKALVSSSDSAHSPKRERADAPTDA